MSRVLCWYSDGVASAVAMKMAKEKYGDILAFFCDTHSEHPDNIRFRKEVEDWVGITVVEHSSLEYKDVDDVIEKTRWLRGVSGARCTTELKKKVRLRIQQPNDKHIFGYTFEEGKRIAQLLSDNWDLRMEAPLYTAKLKKDDCYKIIQEAGIEIPMMYRLGFNNNNCIGCLKAESPNYWNLIRIHFPDVFEKRVKQERELGYALCRHRGKPIYLDELPPDLWPKKKESISCDFVCGGTEAR